MGGSTTSKASFHRGLREPGRVEARSHQVGDSGCRQAQLNFHTGSQNQSGYANTPETRWYYVLYVLKFILYNTAMYYLSVQ